MQLPLDAWQTRLQGHFARLHAARAEQGLPVFALEHGLELAEFDKIAVILRARLKAGMSQSEYWLLWVVYATEFGYRYVGEEYWISFEEQTPGWITQDSAPKLVAWFRKFQKQFGGVVPSGDWARHFNRIALPITNAILPRDLQRSFAQAIYGLRYELVQLRLGDAQEAGRLLASNAWNAPKRFQVFLQQQELAGRILLALLNEEPSDTSPILQTTLNRIIADLESVREAREWLRATRHHVADRFKGAGRDRDDRYLPRTPAERPVPPQDIERLKPKLQLRRTGPAIWMPLLVIPDFTDIGRVSPQLMSFLRQTRARVNGPSDNWMPAGWALGGAKARVLKGWPEEGIRLLSFENENPTLNQIIDGDFRFREKQNWLFHIGSDGIAREIDAANVRPKEEYVIASRDACAIEDHLFSPCTVTCEGIHGIHLRCPSAFTVDDIQALQSFGLQVSQSVRIWPAGLSARSWDGNGHSEWLTTETPCFGIVHDHPVDSYDVQFDGKHACTIRPSSPGKPAFLCLSRLAAGVHRLDVTANRIGVAANNRPGADLKGFINLVVRAPKSWVAGTTAHAGLIVSLDPPQPNLEEFWEGETGLSVIGPEGVRVRCDIELKDRAGAILLSKEIASFDLPLAGSSWNNRFRKFVEHDDSLWKFAEAASGRLTIKTEELGNFVLNLERPIAPVRWYCRTIHKTTSVRLLDDSGAEGMLEALHYYTFRRPAVACALPSTLLSESRVVADAGGLFHAAHGGLSDSLIVSTRHAEGGLQGLLIEPDLRDLAGADANGFLRILELWEPTRFVGPFAGQRKERVIASLVHQMLAAFCGQRWATAESNYLSNGADTMRREIEDAIGLRHSGFLAVIRRDGEKVGPNFSEVCGWFSEIAERYSICDDEEVCAFALALANQPSGLRSKYKGEFASLLARTASNPVLIRSARYLSLLVRSANQGRLVKWT